MATYRVAVKVCDWTVGLESNCDTYYDDNTPAPTNTYTYKPQGLLQRMAVNANGSAGTNRRHDYDAVRSDLRQL